MQFKALLSAAVLALLTTAPSFGQNQQGQQGQNQNNQNGSGNHISRSVPGPVVALGLPGLVAVGGYVWWRRRFRNKT